MKRNLAESYQQVPEEIMSKKKLSIALATVAALTAVWLLASARTGPSNKPAKAADSTAQSPLVSLPRTQIKVVRFALYDAGIYPREIHVGQGRVSISLVDYTGGTEGLVVEREVQGLRQLVGRARRLGAHWRGHQEFDITPGTYRLCDASHPANCATLFVEP